MDPKQWIRDVVDSGDGRERGKTRAGLARALNRAPSAVNRLLDGDQELKVSDIAAISDYLEVEPPPFHRSRFVPLLGKVAGGNSQAILYGDNGAPLDWIAVPYFGDLARAVLEVEGDSMRGVAGHGFFVFIDRPHAPPTPDQMDKLCVCELGDGQRVVKTLHASRYEGRYDLHSASGEHLIAQTVRWAAEVVNIVPGAAASRLERRSEMGDAGEFLKFENLD